MGSLEKFSKKKETTTMKTALLCTLLVSPWLLSSGLSSAEARNCSLNALLITGGRYGFYSAEVFIPSTGQHCVLPNIPGEDRYGHTSEKLSVCGGGGYTSTRTSCLTLTNGTWETSKILQEERYYHSSWASPSGVILLGGENSTRNSERIQDDGTSTDSFSLGYDLSGACAINTGQTVVLTGGYDSPTRVSELSQSGVLTDLPKLQQGRYGHGCSFYTNEDNIKTYLVAGGYDGDFLSSTELLTDAATAWVFSGQLPSPRNGLRGANIDGKILMTGGGIYDGDDYIYYDEIVEFSP